MLRRSHYGYPLIILGLLAITPAAHADTFFKRVRTYFFPPDCQVTLNNDDALERTFYVAPGTITRTFSSEAELQEVAKALKPGTSVRLWETKFTDAQAFTVYVKNPKFNADAPDSAPFTARHHVRVSCKQALDVSLSAVQQKSTGELSVQHLYSKETMLAGLAILKQLSKTRGMR